MSQNNALIQNYKNTLNLPRTNFPMKANLVKREPEIIAKWQEMNLYEKLIDLRHDSPTFVLNDGPPYANGDIHLGHAFNKILKDIINKSKLMSGYKVLYVPGWDCHGLPIELNVEKKLGKVGQNVDIKAFRQACREYAYQQVKKQKKSFIRLGVLANWKHPYITMDFHFEANIIRTLADVIKNGHLKRDYKPVHWCTQCRSALAEAEVEYQEKQSHSLYVCFEVDDKQALYKVLGIDNLDKPVGLAIWTTIPWTLPANVAVSVHPDQNYNLIENEYYYLLVAANLMDTCVKIFGYNNTQKITEYHCKGKKLEHILLKHPFAKRTVPIILGKYVTTDTGTGCVHTAPTHGLDDYIVAKNYKLNNINLVEDNGWFNDEAGDDLVGIHVFNANELIIEKLKKNGNLLYHTKVHHSYPHCWRHKIPLIFRATAQWFISMTQKNLKAKALHAIIHDVKWFPSWGQNRMITMLENRPDWCISRQRVWGVPIPLFLHRDTQKIHPNTFKIMQKIANIVEKQGINAWLDLDPTTYLSDQSDQFYKSNDILDVWFDSGSVYACILDQNFPADLYLEGSDQHRGWFQTSLLLSIATKGMPPYRHVLTHGFTLDPKGQKMSKSLGNTIEPDKVMKTLGADILRLWAASVDYRSDVHVSEKILKQNADTYRRLRNTARFLLANLHDFDPNTDLISAEKMIAIDQWIVKKSWSIQQNICHAYEQYKFHSIYQIIHNFCINELSSFYLDVIKDRQYTTYKESVARRSCQTAIYYIIEMLVRWFSPILSFTAEEIWAFMPNRPTPSVMLSTWFENIPTLLQKKLTKTDIWPQILLVRNEVNKNIEVLRQNSEIGSGLEAEVILYCDEQLLKVLQGLEDELNFVLITSLACAKKNIEATAQAVQTQLPGLKIQINKLTDAKCQRCWHRRSDIDQYKQYPNICTRCVTNLTQPGETRKYA